MFYTRKYVNNLWMGDHNTFMLQLPCVVLEMIVYALLASRCVGRNMRIFTAWVLLFLKASGIPYIS